MRFTRRARLFVALLGIGVVGRAPIDASDDLLEPTNYAAGEIVRTPVVLLRGSAPASATDVLLTNESSRRDSRELRGLAHKGRYLALAELVPGDNRLLLKCGASERRISLVYRPQTNSRVVRCIYLTDSTGDTAYQSQRADEVQNYVGKLDTSMKLLQCFTAERMHDLGFGRVTFCLELDANGKVDVHLLKGERPAAEEYGPDDQAWWRRVADLVHRKLPHPSAKNVVVAAYTRFDPATRKVYGHTALGGGDLGLFGSAGMFAWPTRLQDVFPTFADTTPIDGTRVHDDSVGRSTVWGLASTTLGAVLHETGHAFGLPHTTHPLDIMTRGFDRLNRVFSLVEPPPKSGGAMREFTLDEAGQFAPVSAACLKASRWFALDDVAVADASPPTVEFDDDGGAVIRSDTGLRYLGLLRRGDAVDFRSYWDASTPAPREAKLSPGDLAPAGGPIEEVRAVDALGVTTTERVVRPARFVRAWRFSKESKPWTDPSRFVELDLKQIDRLAVSTNAQRLVASTSAYVDFLPRFDRSQNVAAYAARTVVVPAPTKVRLLTGSDDALRVWIAGALVQQKLTMRGARPDEESVEVSLVKGRNIVFVEVSQGSGGWGLYLRFESLEGAPLHLTDDGDLIPTR